MSSQLLGKIKMDDTKDWLYDLELGSDYNVEKGRVVCERAQGDIT